jgi:hypothetical protein
MQRAAVAPPRGPRGASPSVRGAGRGGIQKRRGGGPARVDKDGDLVMDAAATGDKRRSGRGHIEGGAASKPLGTGRTNSGPGRGGKRSSSTASHLAWYGIPTGKRSGSTHHHWTHDFAYRRTLFQQGRCKPRRWSREPPRISGTKSKWTGRQIEQAS